MPLTFPSHPGLILPLWVARSRRFDALALCVGAMVPDVLKGALYPHSEDLARVASHSIVGLLVDVPLAMAVVYAVDVGGAALLARRARPASAGTLLPPGTPPPPQTSRLVAPRWLPGRVLLSTAVGAASHLLFDGITHRTLDWFRPWWNPDILPRRAGGPWIWLRLKGSDETWTLGFYELQWVLWSLLGAALFAWCVWTNRGLRSWR